jgi:hypothetical protein
MSTFVAIVVGTSLGMLLLSAWLGRLWKLGCGHSLALMEAANVRERKL